MIMKYGIASESLCYFSCLLYLITLPNVWSSDRPSRLSTRGRPPSLAMLLTLLVQGIKQFNVSLDVHKQHTRKLDSLPALSSEEVKEVGYL